ncbi:hypothetical protein ACFFV7_07100 [Nonomuraea spiralis]|uniref:Uncharacterized protein n=1 Tax=Nonomuraea spiralis TaxID=46182 RepID=A0ABV5I8V4_9ACTN|nr:hypothetical protein [Nonomuraea spiralis]
MRLQLILPLAVLLFSTPAPDGGTAVVYTCTTRATGETQTVKIDLTLTVPATAAVGKQFTIGWRGSYVAGAELRAPATGLDGEVNLYAYASVTGIDRLTSATGVGRPGTIVPGAVIPLPGSVVDVKTTPRHPGTGTVRPAAVNFGPTPQKPLIECDPQDKEALTSYPLTVTGTGDDTETTPGPDTTDTASTPPEPGSPTKTPAALPTGGADTGGGGETGPDGRVLVAAGALTLAAALTGLRLRRRTDGTGSPAVPGQEGS